MLDDAHRPRPGSRSGDRASRVGRSPQQLFADFLTEENVEDPRLNAMFAELLDDVTSDPSGLAAMTGEA